MLNDKLRKDLRKERLTDSVYRAIQDDKGWSALMAHSEGSDMRVDLVAIDAAYKKVTPISKKSFQSFYDLMCDIERSEGAEAVDPAAHSEGGTLRIMGELLKEDEFDARAACGVVFAMINQLWSSVEKDPTYVAFRNGRDEVPRT